MSNTVTLVRSGDLRPAANDATWPAQVAVEKDLEKVLGDLDYQTFQAVDVDPELGHGFITSQKMGMDVFKNIHLDSPLIVVITGWQYTHHVFSGLLTHKGPILTLGNWSGQFPGLVGLLNLNGSLVKAGVEFSTIWSLDFTDEFFLTSLQRWLETGKITHNLDHVHSDFSVPQEAAEIGKRLGEELLQNKAIIGVFDEGCMGMYNAIVPDHLLHDTGIFKERLSQSALYAAMLTVSDEEAQAVRDWLTDAGLTFVTGEDPANDLTDDQILDQCRMYIAVLRMGHDFGCDAVGIQYQQGLKDLTPASDLVEGLLNNVNRPPAYHAETGEELYAGQMVPHFNEVDECAAIDGLITTRVWRELDLEPENTLHDVRWGEYVEGQDRNGRDLNAFVWQFMISGAAPANHFEGEYKGAVVERQPAMFFKKGGGTLKGESKPGEIVWSRVFVESDALHMDIGRGAAVALPEEQVQMRWETTDPTWPMMNAILYGVDRDQLMSRHRANHIQVAYAPSVEAANQALATKIAMAQTLGIAVHVCGTDNGLT